MRERCDEHQKEEKRTLPVCTNEGRRGLNGPRSMRGLSAVTVLVLIPVVLVVIFAAVVAFYEGRKAYWDHRVREMCKEDGGLHVHERVTLPRERFDQYGVVHIPDKGDATQSDKYYYETNRHYYRRGNPQVSRREYQIIRRGDQKVLGELIFYGRGGGDVPGPWHGSSFTCPDPTTVANFESSVFIQGDEK